MEIPVRLHLLDSDDGNGVKLWALPSDGSGRAWYKWYEDEATAMMDAENMLLLETPVQHSPTASQYALTHRQILLDEATMQETMLDAYWKRASNSHARHIADSTLEIDFPISAITDVFESDRLPKGMTREAPGGATMELRAVPTPEQPPQLAYDYAPIFTVAVNLGRDVAVGVFASWLYDKLKAASVRRIKINRRTVEATPEGILKAIEESIELEER